MHEYLQQVMGVATNQKASDVHMVTGSPVTIRRDGRLGSISQEVCTPELVDAIIQSLLLPQRYQLFTMDRECDFSFSFNDVRVRANAYFEKAHPAISLRLIPSQIPTPEELGIPAAVVKMLGASQGFVIIAGPTGHGKSTTLAALVEMINATRSEHIITLEDPIEYIFTPKKSIVSQREVGVDTVTFESGLRASLREDPNVILVGEMRDLSTIETALTLAETGHLVLATLHTNSASQTADRIIDVFPEQKQPQIRLQFANSLLGIVSQRLLPKIQGGRVLVSEILLANSAVRSLIREGKVHQIPNVIQTSTAEGMMALDNQLAKLVTDGSITMEQAEAWSLDPKNLKMMLYQ
jgi:twitching motility protein PilT